jgi:hypothetical protein
MMESLTPEAPKPDFIKAEKYEAGKWQEFTEQERREIGEALKKGRLSTFFEVLEKYFEVRDRMGFIIVLAAAVAHQVPGEMLWMRVYGASRSGKTELLEAIGKHSDSTDMETITPASIRGGLRGGHKLLNRINGKLVITKDLAAILTSKREVRNEIFGLLRSVKDGKLTADFGIEEKEGHISQEVKFDWLIGTTPVFAQYKQMEDLLGARYVDLNWKAGDREEMAFRAAENSPVLPEIRKSIAQAVCDLMDKAKMKLVPLRADKEALSKLPEDKKLVWNQLKAEERLGLLKEAPEPLPESDLRLLSNWADLTALLRSPVARDRQHRIKFHPEPEVGTDLAQAFVRITQGLKLLGIRNYTPYIARLAHDCIPHSRQQVILELLGGEVNQLV